MAGGGEATAVQRYGRGNRRFHFVATACQFCLCAEDVPGVQLKVCSSCKAITYCSVEHQACPPPPLAPLPSFPLDLYVPPRPLNHLWNRIQRLYLLSEPIPGVICRTLRHGITIY